MTSIINPVLLGIYLWGMTSIVLIVCGAVYYFRGKQKEDRNEKIIMFGFASLYIFFAIGRISFPLIEALDYDISSVAEYNLAYLLYSILIKAYYGFQLIGVLLFIFSFEFVIKRTKYIFTIINLAILIILIISPPNLTIYIYSLIILYFDTVLIYLILILLTKWAQFEFKAVSSLILIGYTLILLGTTLYDLTLREFNEIFHYIPPLLVILGSLISISPIIINPKSFSNAFTYWIILGIVAIALVLSIELYFIFNYGLIPENFIFNSTLFLIFLIFAFYRIIKIIKAQPTPEIHEMPIDILKVFSRPQKITEEEVSVSKEKKICLVCKGKLGRLLYLCPDCSSFYCKKCSDVLSRNENACWVCDTPFDESRPVKQQESIEKEIEIDDATHKKKL